MFFKRCFRSELDVLPVGLQTMELIGLWGSDRRQVVKFGAIASWMTLMIVIPKSSLEYGGEGFDSFARGTAELIYFGDFIWSMVMFAMQRGTYVRMINILQDTFRVCGGDRQAESCRKAIVELNWKVFRYSRIYACFIGSCLIFYVPLPMTATFYVYFTAGNGTDGGEFVLPLENNFYWLDTRKDIWHYVIYMVMLVPAVCGSACLSTVKGTVLFTIIRYGATLFELVTLKIADLDRGENFEDGKATDRRDRLIEVFELHKKALEYAKLLENIMKYILLSQFVCCTMISCLMMFYISSTYGPNVVNMVILFAVLLVEVFAYCYSGGELSSKAAAVADSVSKYPWHLEPVQVQKELKLMMQRAQSPVGVTAGKFYYVDIQRFGLVLKMSYSFYLILMERFK